MQPCILQPNSAEKNNLEITAVMLTKFNKFNRTYTVEDVYFDFRQDWKWTTIIAHKSETGDCLVEYQAVNPKEWNDIISANTANDLMNFITSLLIKINSKS